MSILKPLVPILGMFLSKFDMKKGNIIEWSVGNCSRFDGLEFKSLPSGIHDVSDDLIMFYAIDKVTGHHYHGVSYYKQNSLDIIKGQGSQIDRSRVKMYSLGVILDLVQKNDDNPLKDKEIAYYYANQLSILLSTWLNKNDLTNFDPLNTFYYDHLRLKDDLSIMNVQHNEMNHYTLHWMRRLGPLIFPLWKSIILNERILILNSPGDQIHMANSLCYMLFLISLHCRIKPGGRSTKLLYTIGTSDLEHMRSVLLDKRDGYIACTSDSLLLFKQEIYDKVLVLDSTLNVQEGVEGKIKYLTNQEREIKATPHEYELYRKLEQDLFPEDVVDSREYLKLTEALTWTQYLIDKMYLFTTAGYCNATYHNIDAHDFNRIRDLEHDNGGKVIQRYLRNRTQHLYNSLELIILSREMDESHDEKIIISPMDLKLLQLDCFSEQDYQFITDISAKWHDKEVIVSGIADYIRLAC